MTNPTFDCYQSNVDGVQVVHVDTHDMPENSQGPVIRVYLNEEPIFENPMYPVCFERTIVPKQRERGGTNEIVVTVQGGLVQDVQNIPPGAVVKVMDLDDEAEEKCLVSFWGKD